MDDKLTEPKTTPQRARWELVEILLFVALLLFTVACVALTGAPIG